MSKATTSTRRSFLKSGTMLAAPLAAVAVPAAVMADDDLKKRLARLENEAAIREVHQRWLRVVNAGVDELSAALDSTVHSISADHAGSVDVIEVAADGSRATGRFHCTVEIRTPITEDSTAARMAREQGGGFVRRCECRVLQVAYVKNSATWKIAKVKFENEIS